MRVWTGAAMVCLAVCPLARGAEHVTLKNGFALDCAREVRVGERVRLYFTGAKGSGGTGNGAASDAGDDGSYMEVAASSIARVEEVPDPPTAAAPVAAADPSSGKNAVLTEAELHQMLARAGRAHHIDADMLASVVKAESNGQVRAVSRAGAQGLMQLMPGTAAEMGVRDAFRAKENIDGGTAYLDALLTRYHDNVALALAAYNAGPAAVDRWHGVPPYRETEAYVARVIREFNRRKRAEMVAER